MREVLLVVPQSKTQVFIFVSNLQDNDSQVLQSTRRLGQLKKRALKEGSL